MRPLGFWRAWGLALLLGAFCTAAMVAHAAGWNSLTAAGVLLRMALTERDYARITAALLESAANEFENHGCNEFDGGRGEGNSNEDREVE